MNRKHLLLLLLIFLSVIALRLYFALRSPYFSDDQAYFVQRQVEHIAKTGLPLFYDPLSYGGRVLVFLPLFYYSLAIFAWFMPVSLVLKIIPNIFASLLVFVIYAITMRLANNPKIGIITAAISAAVPIYVSQTVNGASIYSLIMPLLFLTVYFFMRIGEKKVYTTLLVACFFVLVFTDAIVVVLVFALIIYLILAKVEGLKTERSELELALFLLFFAIWSYFIIFKKLFISYGSALVWQNIPSELLSQYFQKITIVGAMNQIGLVPLLAGIYIFYKYIFQLKNKTIYLLISFAISVSLLLWLKLVAFDGGLIILGIILVLLLGQFLKVALNYVQKTKLAELPAYPFVLSGSLLIIFVVTSVLPTLFYTDREIRMGFDEGDIQAMLWLRNSTNTNDVVLGTLRDGHLITSVAQRPNVMDSNFLLIPNINQRLKDLKTIFTTSSEIEAVNLLTQYKVQYIYFSKFAKLTYKRTSLPYTDDINCFQLVYDSEQYQVYKTKCKLEKLD
jgi:hypothetical protein